MLQIRMKIRQIQRNKHKLLLHRIIEKPIATANAAGQTLAQSGVLKGKFQVNAPEQKNLETKDKSPQES